MHPVICQIGPLSIYSFGVMLALAVFVCSFLLAQDAGRHGLQKNIVYDLVFWVMLAGVLGARTFYILLNLGFFIENPQEILMVHHGGLAWQGGLAAGIAAAWIFIRRHRLSVPAIFDLAAPYLALGHAIGRIGCFLNGCCQGRHWDKGIYFSVHQDTLYPTQLYESFLLLTIFFILKLYAQKSRPPGQIFLLYLCLASLERFVVEFFRGDHFQTWLGLSIFQWISAVIFITVLVANYYVSRRKQN